MMRRVLLIDAGNTRIKWAVVEAMRWLDRGAAATDDVPALLADWSRWQPLAACYGVNVAGPTVAQAVERGLAAIALSPLWVQASACACGVSNAYLPPQSLGADRWAALIGARQHSSEDCLVVSAGTALTVDALTRHGQFIGGMIVPGLRLMRQALTNGTAEVGEQCGSVADFPLDTRDAVQTGIVSALAGAIEHMAARFARQTGAAPCCLLSGGDAEMLRPYLTLKTALTPGLVLEGLYCIAQENETQ
jgi:type III pantothenate kinase